MDTRRHWLIRISRFGHFTAPLLDAENQQGNPPPLWATGGRKIMLRYRVTNRNRVLCLSVQEGGGAGAGQQHGGGHGQQRGEDSAVGEGGHWEILTAVLSSQQHAWRLSAQRWHVLGMGL